MDIETLVKSLNNRLIALEAKKKVSIEKGSIELFNVFNKEFIETSVTLDLIKKGLGEGTKSIIVVKDESLEKHTRENRFIRAWKVLIGKL